jgi:arginyl-tRNA synthetase
VKSIQSQLEACFRAAFTAALGEAGRHADPLIRRAQDPKFGDYQSNAAMGLAKALRSKPRDVARRVVDALAALPAFTAMCEPPEIAGPGFINLRLKPAFLSASLSAIPAAPAIPSRESVLDTAAAVRPIDRLGIEPAAEPQTVVVDYSGPNVAKQMHVGHLRSTIIGDVIARVLAFEGHRPIRQNHVGDWGLQMGQMLRRITTSMSSLVAGGADDETAVVADIAEHLEEIERQYKAAQAEEKTNPALAEESRQWVVRLQGGDEEALRIWRRIRQGTLLACQKIYDRLGVLLAEEDVRGESFYNDRLAGTVDELRRTLSGEDGLASVREDQGALCVFHFNEKGEAAFKGSEGNPLPLIIQKSDGAYLYATTDLAAIRFRVRDMHADRIIYVTGEPQTLHFKMVFATARAAGWTRLPDGREVRLEHVAFGSVLGEDRKILRTRSGENVKLKDLLDEAVTRAEQLVRTSEADPAKRRGFTEEQIREIAEAVGIGAVKYADLTQNRTTDYVFSWDKMLAMDGNTAPYMMYAYARIRSIYAKAAESDEAAERRSDEGQGERASGTAQPRVSQSSLELSELAEIDLAKQILQFADTVDAVAEELKPNILTSYLYDLAGAFMRFYENCPVLKAPTAAVRESRLRLCDLAARTLRAGLSLLGIRVVERM